MELLSNKNKYLFLITITIVIALLFVYVKQVFTYLLISLVISLLGNPIVLKLSSFSIGRFKLSKGLSSFITLLFFYLLITGFFMLMIPLFVSEVEQIGSLNSEAVWRTFKQPIYDLLTLIGVDVSVEEVQLFVQNKLYSLMDVAGISSIFNSMVGFIGNTFVALFSISFISFFLLKDEGLFKQGVSLLTPNLYRDQVNDVLHKSKVLMRKYFGGLIIEMLINSLLIGVGLGLLGVSNFYIIAFFYGILLVIPYVGPFISYILALMFGITELMESDFYHILLPQMLKISAVFVVVNIIDGFIIYPYIFSNTLKAHPLEIFLVLLTAGTIGGIGAMMIAIPAYSVIRIVAQEFLSNFELVRKLTGEE